MRRYTAVVVACLLMISMLMGCTADAPPPETEKPAETEALIQTEATELPEKADAKGIAVKTKFGNLYYQDQWEDFMQVVLSEEDDSVVAVFVAEINGMKYTLFQLTIGDGEEEPAGWITDAQGEKHGVFVSMEEIGIIPELTEGEQNRLFAMQEEINYILENIE